MICSVAEVFPQLSDILIASVMLRNLATTTSVKGVSHICDQVRPQHPARPWTYCSLAGNANDRKQRMGNALPSRMKLVRRYWTANPWDLFEHVQKSNHGRVTIAKYSNTCGGRIGIERDTFTTCRRLTSSRQQRAKNALIAGPSSF